MIVSEGIKVRKCYSGLKMMIEACLRVGFFTIFFIKSTSLRRFRLYMKLLQSSTIFKQKINDEVSCDENFCMRFFTTLNSKKLIALLAIVTIKNSELTFLLIFYFHGNTLKSTERGIVDQTIIIYRLIFSTDYILLFS